MRIAIATAYDALKERYAERWALVACRSAAFIQCLEACDIAPSLAVSTPRGKSIIIHASDIFAARKKFLADLDLEQDACHMTSIGDTLVSLFVDWIMHEYSGRYRYIVSDDQRKWLRQVVILVVARHLMHQKYTLYTAQGRQAFSDAWACSEMCRLQILSSLTGELARLVHHIMDTAERQQALIDQFYDDLDVRMRACSLTVPEPLPPLPEGAILPFALLSQGRGFDV